MAKARKKTAGRHVVANMFYIVFLSFVMVAGALAGWFGESSVGTELVRQKFFKTPPQVVFGTESSPTGSITLLILGCDETRANDKSVTAKQARSDMMMVAKLDFNRRQIGAVSIPRDTLCQLPGYDRQKINAYHALGGPELATEAVEHLLEVVTIDRTVVLNFETFQEIVDMVGGVEIYVPKKMDYDDNWGDLHIHLEKGRQTLTGYQAMGFVRFRHNDSDFERQKRQQDLMLALKERMVKEWQKAPQLLDKTVELTSDAFNVPEIASLAIFAQSLDKERIKMGQIPVTEIKGTYNLAVNQSQLVQTLEDYHIIPKGDD